MFVHLWNERPSKAVTSHLTSVWTLKGAIWLPVWGRFTLMMAEARWGNQMTSTRKSVPLSTTVASILALKESVYSDCWQIPYIWFSVYKCFYAFISTWAVKAQLTIPHVLQAERTYWLSSYKGVFLQPFKRPSIFYSTNSINLTFPSDPTIAQLLSVNPAFFLLSAGVSASAQPQSSPFCTCWLCAAAALPCKGEEPRRGFVRSAGSIDANKSSTSVEEK